jgi:hypothetical protein
MGPTEHHDIAAQTITEPMPCSNVGTESGILESGFVGCSLEVNPSRCREQCEGRLNRPYHLRVFSCLTVVTPSFTHLRITFSNQRFSNCSPTVDAGFVKLTSDSFCGNRVF